MKYWIIIDSVQKGPLTFEELSVQPGLNPSTPLWHEGLSDWTTAGAVPEVATLFSGSDGAPYQAQQPGQGYGQASAGNQQGGYYNQGWQQNYAQGNPYGQYNQQYYGQNPAGQGFDPNRMPPMPSNYLIWAIVMTICCCIPTGIVAIFYAAKVSPAYYRGDYMGALDASSKAQLWIIISFVAGLIWAPFSVLFSLMSA